MKRNKVVIVLLCLLGILLIGCGNQKSNPLAKQGIMDVSSWNFENNGTMQLLGEWEFYWKKLLTPADFNKTQKPKMTGYIASPAVWNKYVVDGRSLSGEGYATFRMRIKNLDPQARYAFKVLYMSTAYRLWLNGKLTGTNGVVGSNKKSVSPKYLPLLYEVSPEKGAIEVIVQVSNYHYKNGGIKRIIRFGLAKDIIQENWLSKGIVYFVIGSLFLSAIYQFGLFFLRRNDKPSLYFGLFCFSLAVHFFSTGETVIVKIMPSIDWFLVVKIHYLSSWISVALFFKYFQSVFYQQTNKHFVDIIMWVFLILNSVIIVTPPEVYTPLALVFQISSAVIFGYILVKMVVLSYRKDVFARMFLFGYAFAVSSTISDFLFYNFFHKSGFLMIFGIFVLVLFQTFILSFKSSKAFALTEELTQNLEKKVKYRTLQLRLKNRELRKQRKQKEQLIDRLEAVNILKDEFLGMISHDLKNPAVAINLYSDILSRAVDGKVAAKHMEYIQNIKNSSSEMFTLLEDLVDISQIESGQFTINRSSVDYIEFIRNNISLNSAVAEESGNELVFECAISKAQISIDTHRINQVLNNLINNAIKFSPESKDVVISVIKTNNELRTVVRDNGSGIKKTEMQNIFKKYHTGRTEINANKSGVGLGLAIVKKIVEAHDGKIEAGNHPQGGAQLSFTLPI